MGRRREASAPVWRALAFLAAVAPLGCTGISRPAPAEIGPAPTPAHHVGGLRAALLDTLESPSARAKLRLFAERFADDGHTRGELFGSGVGIWNGERQFTPSPPEIEAAIRLALDAGLPEMAPSYGGRAEGRSRGAPPAEGAHAADRGGGPVRLVCAVEIEAGGVVHRVEQIAGGDQHAPLVELAAGLLARWRAAGEAGVAAAGLDEGLAAIAGGGLAPETLRLTLHEKPELGTEGRGLLLRLRGRALTRRPFTAATGYGATVMHQHARDEVRARAGRLAELRPGRLPINLFAPDYVDLAIEVLGHRVAVQARRFAGMTAETHGAAQRDFDRLLEPLRELGRAPADATTADSPARDR